MLTKCKECGIEKDQNLTLRRCIYITAALICFAITYVFPLMFIGGILFYWRSEKRYGMTCNVCSGRTVPLMREQ